MAALFTEINAILRRMLCDNEMDVTSGTRFEDLNGWDSMDLVTIVVEVECHYGLMFEPREIEHLITVGDLMRVVMAKRTLASA